jgi:hypothetical protein
LTCTPEAVCCSSTILWHDQSIHQWRLWLTQPSMRKLC